jgi:hypothetical protein
VSSSVEKKPAFNGFGKQILILHCENRIFILIKKMPSSQPLPPKENALFKRILVGCLFGEKKNVVLSSINRSKYCDFYRKVTNKSSIKMDLSLPNRFSAIQSLLNMEVLSGAIHLLYIYVFLLFI